MADQLAIAGFVRPHGVEEATSKRRAPSRKRLAENLAPSLSVRTSIMNSA
jgi:hypothetical protein